MKSALKTRKKRKYEIKEIKEKHKSPSKRWFRNRIHSPLRLADAKGAMT